MPSRRCFLVAPPGGHGIAAKRCALTRCIFARRCVCWCAWHPVGSGAGPFREIVAASTAARGAHHKQSRGSRNLVKQIRTEEAALSRGIPASQVAGPSHFPFTRLNILFHSMLSRSHPRFANYISLPLRRLCTLRCRCPQVIRVSTHSVGCARAECAPRINKRHPSKVVAHAPV